jgi:Family of unknown function (DUF5988)
MFNTESGPAADLGVATVLDGGPTDFPDALRRQRHPVDQDGKIKIPHRGGYEHFQRGTGGCAGPPVNADLTEVYRWIGRTEIAE